MRSDDELAEAAHHVAYEWGMVVAAAARLATITSARSALENSLLESSLLHYRCVVNFCCGNYVGRWLSNDITPEDFLGRPWWPQDEELDRHLRGRLPGINGLLTHLTWDRSKIAVMWPFGLLAHEADHVMRLFLDEVPPGATWRRPLDMQSVQNRTMLPAPQRWSATVVERAPKRRAA